MAINLPIYMDNQATTPLDKRVLDSMMPFLTDQFGNAASLNHSFGWEALQAVKSGRESILKAFGGEKGDLIFTSGATESINLVLKGLTHFLKHSHVITAATEHKAVLDCCSYLSSLGVEITILPVDSNGLVDPAAVKNSIKKNTCLVSIMLANNEIGTIAPMQEIAAICNESGILLHSDATQAMGKIAVDLNNSGIDLVSFSGHKIYGPKGIGALWIRKKTPRILLSPQIHGGGHEQGLRSGTLNVPAIVGFGTACTLAARELDTESKRLLELRNRLWENISSELEGVVLNGDAEKRLPGNLNVSFSGVEGESILLGMREVALSSGSACTTASLEPSHVLQAIGADSARGHGAIRFGIGRFNTREEIDYVSEKLIKTVTKLRKISAGIF